ncbi:MAG: hypothetical protein ACWA5A_11510 [Marinibacterium sp.]
MTVSAMRKGAMLAMAVAIALAPAGCGRKNRAAANTEPTASQLNPLLPPKADKIAARNAPDTGGATIDTITALNVESTVEGAIVRAEGIAARQGAYDARLIPDPDGPDREGVLAFTFKVHYPPKQTGAGPVATRTILVARDLNARELRGIRTIRVSATDNSREARRR